MGPPTDIPATDLWRKLQETPRPSDVVDFPRKDSDGNPIGKIRIQVLSQEQHDEARQRAQELLVNKKKIPIDHLRTDLMREVMADTCAKEVLALACFTVEAIPGTDPPRYGRQFPDGPSIGQKLSADEIGVLFTQYTIVQNKYGPYEGNVDTEDDLSAWIKRLAEGASAYPLAQLGLLELVGLCMSLARRSSILSEALELHWQSLPDTLKSDLGRFSLGTGFFGAQPAEQQTPDSESSDPRLLDDEPMSVERAAEIAKRLHKHGQ